MLLKKIPAICALALGLAIGPEGASAQSNPQVLIKTSEGEIVVELYPDKAPKSVANFLQYVDDDHYDGTIFHRVISGFMIQGGGFGADFYDGNLQTRKTRAPIEIESNNGLKNDRGTIAMARTGDPNSATSQFYINVVDNDSLNYPGHDGYGYTVFGRVIEGMDVVDRIRKVPTGTVGPFRDVPREPVLIESVVRVGG
jgi:peptidyl-prolyl cis-trans isomerase A (cyclophilin A)